MLMRFDPFRDLERLTRQAWGPARQAAMPMDAYRHEGQFVVRFDIPGIDPSSIDLTVEKNVLTVRAERASQWGEGVEWLVAERPQGTFSRQIFLGDALDTEHIDASYENGVLTLTIPLAEQTKPRKIEIGGARAGAIEAESTAA